MHRQSEKNLLSSGISSTCPDNMVNFGPLTAEIFSLVWAPLQISTGFASWQRYCTASSSGRQPNFAALNRGRHLCSAGRPSGWALAHILVHTISVIRTPDGVIRPHHQQTQQSSPRLRAVNASDSEMICTLLKSIVWHDNCRLWARKESKVYLLVNIATNTNVFVVEYLKQHV